MSMDLTNAAHLAYVNVGKSNKSDLVCARHTMQKRPQHNCVKMSLAEPKEIHKNAQKFSNLESKRKSDFLHIFMADGCAAGNAMGVRKKHICLCTMSLPILLNHGCTYFMTAITLSARSGKNRKNISIEKEPTMQWKVVKSPSGATESQKHTQRGGTQGRNGPSSIHVDPFYFSFCHWAWK